MDAEKRACIFAASRLGGNACHERAAREVGELLAERGWVAIFGAGPGGLMGIFSQAYTAARGRQLIGIAPNDLYEKEKRAHKVDMTVLTTPTIYERKRRMIEGTTLFIALPGGVGTSDELFEVLEMRFHRETMARIVLYAPDDFWDTLLRYVDLMIEAGYATLEHRALVERAFSVAELAQILDEIEMETVATAEKS